MLSQEGRQASLAADFSIKQFRCLGRLLMWHGRNRLGLGWNELCFAANLHLHILPVERFFVESLLACRMSFASLVFREDAKQANYAKYKRRERHRTANKLAREKISASRVTFTISLPKRPTIVVHVPHKTIALRELSLSLPRKLVI